MTINATPPPSRTVTTDRLQVGENGEYTTYYTLTRVGAVITSSLGMKTTTELCRQKRRRPDVDVYKYNYSYPIVTTCLYTSALLVAELGNSCLHPY